MEEGGSQRQVAAYRDRTGNHSQSHLGITAYSVQCSFNIWKTCRDISATLRDFVWSHWETGVNTQKGQHLPVYKEQSFGTIIVGVSSSPRSTWLCWMTLPVLPCCSVLIRWNFTIKHLGLTAIICKNCVISVLANYMTTSNCCETLCSVPHILPVGTGAGDHNRGQAHSMSSYKVAASGCLRLAKPLRRWGVAGEFIRYRKL